MKTKKTIQELTIIDNFMFGAVMTIPDNCRELLERTLDIEIDHIEVSKEKCMIYNPEYKGVRLDVYAKDENHTHYNVEMQAIRKPALMKRSRYYLSHIDMEILLSGVSYKELPNTYVIFICDFDPFGKKKYRYTRKQVCEEVPGLNMEDGSHVIFLSTQGTNVEEIPRELVNFLEYVKAPLSDCNRDFEDEFISQLQDTVRQIKESREMGARYMILEEMLNDEREDGRHEGIILGKADDVVELLQEVGEIPQELQERIITETDIEVLKKWLKLAAKVESIEQFLKNM